MSFELNADPQGLPETWMMPDEMDQAILWSFLSFKTSPHAHFAVKLQKTLVDNKTSPDFPSA